MEYKIRNVFNNAKTIVFVFVILTITSCRDKKQITLGGVIQRNDLGVFLKGAKEVELNNKWMKAVFYNSPFERKDSIIFLFNSNIVYKGLYSDTLHLADQKMRAAIAPTILFKHENEWRMLIKKGASFTLSDSAVTIIFLPCTSTVDDQFIVCSGMVH